MPKRLFRHHIKRYALPLFPFFLLSCGKSDPGGDGKGTWKSEIRLEDAVADQGCLSLPRLFDGIRSLNPGLHATTVPTSIAFESSSSVRESFRRLLAYGQLTIQRRAVSEEQQSLPGVSQQDCSALGVTGSDGVETPYTVKESSRERILAEAEDGERIEYSWLSPTSLLSRRRYRAYDSPCVSGDEAILVTVARVLDWSGSALPAVVPEAGATLSIEPRFLAWAAAAVGEDPAALYVSPPVGEGPRMIDLSKVSALADKPPLSEVLSCDGSVSSPPEPTPEERSREDPEGSRLSL